MRISVLKKLAALGAVLALTGAGLLASAAGASAQSPPRTAAITPIFNLNGAFSDGGSARPEISHWQLRRSNKTHRRHCNR